MTHIHAKHMRLPTSALMLLPFRLIAACLLIAICLLAPLDSYGAQAAASAQDGKAKWEDLLGQSEQSIQYTVALSDAVNQHHISITQLDFTEEGDPGYPSHSPYSAIDLVNRYMTKRKIWSSPHPHLYSQHYIDSLTTFKGVRPLFNSRHVYSPDEAGHYVNILYLIIPHFRPVDCEVIRHTDGTPMGPLQYIAPPSFIISKNNRQILDMPADFYTQDPNRTGRMIDKRHVCIHVGNVLYQYSPLIQQQIAKR